MGTVENPLRLFEDSEKTAAKRAAFSTYLYHPSFPHVPRKFCHQVMLGQVTGSGQVTVPPKKFVILRWLPLINMKLPGYLKTISNYKTYISDFRFQ